MVKASRKKPVLSMYRWQGAKAMSHLEAINEHKVPFTFPLDNGCKFHPKCVSCPFPVCREHFHGDEAWQTACEAFNGKSSNS